jgi:hypothetical protein
MHECLWRISLIFTTQVLLKLFNAAFCVLQHFAHDCGDGMLLCATDKLKMILFCYHLCDNLFQLCYVVVTVNYNKQLLPTSTLHCPSCIFFRHLSGWYVWSCIIDTFLSARFPTWFLPTLSRFSGILFFIYADWPPLMTGIPPHPPPLHLLPVCPPPFPVLRKTTRKVSVSALEGPKKKKVQ